MKHDNKNSLRKFPNQFLVGKSHGGLTDSQLGTIRDEITNTSFDEVKNIKFKIGTDRKMVNILNKALKGLKNVEIVEIEISNLVSTYLNSKQEGDPDLVILAMSLNYKENIIELYEAISANIFQFDSTQDRISWLEKYLAEEDLLKRSNSLQTVHFRSVYINPTVVPLSSFVINSYLNKRWKLNIDPSYHLSPFQYISKAND